MRLARQLPTNLSRDDVEETLRRMDQRLSENSQTCIHGRPFLHHLSEVPSTEQEAKALLRPLEMGEVETLLKNLSSATSVKQQSELPDAFPSSATDAQRSTNYT